MALGFAVTGSQSGGGKNAGDEKADATASEILSGMTQIKTGWDRLRVTKGCETIGIDFYIAGHSSYGNSRMYPNGIPTDRTCSIYDAVGAALSPKTIPASAGLLTGSVGSAFYATAYMPLRAFIRFVGQDFSGAPTPEAALDFVITAHFSSEAVCKKFNNQVGFGTKDATPPAGSSGFYIMSQGGFLAVSAPSTAYNTNALSSLNGAHAACFQSNYAGSYYTTAPHYIAYMVLHAG